VECISNESQWFGVEAHGYFSREEAEGYGYDSSKTCLSADLEATMLVVMCRLVVVVAMSHDVEDGMTA
jgi:hypothetical protein